MTRGAALLPVALLGGACNAIFGFEEATPRELDPHLPTCASGWTRRLPITLDNRTGKTLTAHQVRITLDTASLILAGTLRADGADVRFTVEDGETSIPYVIEKDLGTTATELWIKVPVLPVGTSRILLHHGNAAATRADSVGDVFVAGVVPNASFETGGGWVVTPPVTPPSRWFAVWPTTNFRTEGANALGIDLEYDVFTEGPMRMAIGQDIELPKGGDHILRFDVNLRAASPGELGARLTWSVGGAEVWRLFGLDEPNITGVRIGQETLPLAPGATRLELAVAIHDALGGYVEGFVDNLRVRKVAVPEPTAVVGEDVAACP